MLPSRVAAFLGLDAAGRGDGDGDGGGDGGGDGKGPPPVPPPPALSVVHAGCTADEAVEDVEAAARRLGARKRSRETRNSRGGGGGSEKARKRAHWCH